MRESRPADDSEVKATKKGGRVTVHHGAGTASKSFEKAAMNLVSANEGLALPSEVRAIASETLCGLPIGASINTVVTSWGPPVAFDIGLDDRDRLAYQFSELYFDARGRLAWCRVGNGEIEHVGLGIKLGQARDSMAIPEVQAQKGTYVELKGTKSGLRGLEFADDGRLTSMEFARTVRSVPVRVEDLSHWSLALQRLQQAVPNALPEAEVLGWKPKPQRALGFHKLPPRPNAVVALWGKPAGIAVSASEKRITRIGYVYSGGDTAVFSWDRQRFSAVLTADSGATFNGRVFGPGGVTFAIALKQVGELLGKPESHDLGIWTYAMARRLYFAVSSTETGNVTVQEMTFSTAITAQ